MLTFKPKFLTKAERARLALAKREEEVKEQKEKEDVEKKQHLELERAAVEERRRQESTKCKLPVPNIQLTPDGRDRDSRDNGRDHRDRDGLDYRERNDRGGRDGRRDDRGGRRDDRRDNRQGGRPSNGSNGAANGTSTKPGDELETIKKRYLGQQDVVKKPWMRKTAKKDQIFEWNAGDDTSAQPLWTPPVNGNGTPAAGSPAPASSVGSPAPGTSEKYTDALERRRAGKGSNDDRHWSDKPLEEMRERDWRIFREDYSISSRGGNIPFPLRTWRESEIPSKLVDIIDKVGYTEPSPIQRQAIPIGLQNRDLVGLAKTGEQKV